MVRGNMPRDDALAQFCVNACVEAFVRAFEIQNHNRALTTRFSAWNRKVHKMRRSRAGCDVLTCPRASRDSDLSRDLCAPAAFPRRRMGAACEQPFAVAKGSQSRPARLKEFQLRF